MKVLVTGSNGYIGTILVPMLLERGHEVIGLDSDLYRHSTYGNSFTPHPFVNKDIREIEMEDLEGFDAILHLAGLSNDPLGDLDPDLTLDINYRASVRLAEMSKAVGIKRFIFSSSCSTYGAAGDDFIDESTDFNPVTPYGKSKVKVEQEVSKMADDTFCPVFLRNATAYGVSPRLRFDLVLNNLTAWSYTTGLVYLKSDGTPWRPIVHIEDISRAFIAALEAPTDLVHNQAFNVAANGENYQIRELADFVKEIVPDSDVQFAEDAGPDLRCYRVDCSKITKTLPDFEVKWTARKGVRELYDTYVQNGLKLEEFEGPKYRRLDHIKQLIEIGALDASLRWIDESITPPHG